MQTILVLGGSDPSGCSGIQADLRAISAFGVHGAAVVTALTAQSTREMRGWWPLPAAQVRAQLEVVLEDLDVAAIKVGMPGSPGAVREVANALEDRPDVPLVLDPVLRSSTGGALCDAETRRAVADLLVPRATVVTPNVHELEAMTGCAVRSLAEREGAARELLERGAVAVLVKGGHLRRDRGTDALVTRERTMVLRGSTLVAEHDRGTGCTLASALAVLLGRSIPLSHAVAVARRFVRRALGGGYAIGAGPGPLDAAPGWRRAHVPRLGRLHAITDAGGPLGAHLERLVRSMLRGGVDTVQLRDKGRTATADLVASAQGLPALCHRSGAALLVDDRPDVAVAVGADGAHVGREDLPPTAARALLGPTALLGATANSVAEARGVLSEGAEPIDYLGVGPVFGTRSKSRPAPALGLEALATICAESPVPVIAIGGVTPERVVEVARAGAFGVAVLSGIAHAADPGFAARRYAAAVQESFGAPEVVSRERSHGAVVRSSAGATR